MFRYIKVLCYISRGLLYRLCLFLVDNNTNSSFGQKVKTRCIIQESVNSFFYQKGVEYLVVKTIFRCITLNFYSNAPQFIVFISGRIYDFRKKRISNNCFFFTQADIVGVNEIFRDLATMVYEQGDMIGTRSLFTSFSLILFIFVTVIKQFVHIFYRQH